MVDIGRIGISTEISILSSRNAYPLEGHFETVLHVMEYLKIKHNYQLVMDPNYPPINEANFKYHDWTAFYGDVQEAIPVNDPASCGKEVVIRMMVDSDHAGDEAYHRSRTSYMIYVKMHLIDWLSKK